MARFVPDSRTGRWVIIAPARITRPHDNQPFTEEAAGQPSFAKATAGKCVFCPGNEWLNPGEVFRVGGAPGDENWQIRVIKNKFPIADLHEVIIHSPSHERDIDELPLSQAELILTTYRQRYNFHMANKNGTVLIFNNHDAHAGASIKHPHSQLVVIPSQITLEAIPREPTQNVVLQTKYFTAYCPDFSQWPYEIWLAPRNEEPAPGERDSLKMDKLDALDAELLNSRNQDQEIKESSGQVQENLSSDSKKSIAFGSITDAEIADLAPLLQKVLAFILQKFSQAGAMKQAGSDPDVPYNYYIYHGKDWYLRIIPRLVHRAGFELGTGLSVNIVDPAKAAEEYRAGLR